MHELQIDKLLLRARGTV